MKSTGVVRRVDDLGRVVIPKEVRRTLRIKEGDPLELFIGDNKTLVFRKYEPLTEVIKNESDGLIAAFEKAFNANIIVTDDAGYILSSTISSFVGKTVNPEKIKAYRDGEIDFINSIYINDELISIPGCHRITNDKTRTNSCCEGVVLVFGDMHTSDSVAKALAITIGEKVAEHIW